MAAHPAPDNQAYMHGKDDPAPEYAPQGQYPRGAYPPPQQPGQPQVPYGAVQPGPYVAQPVATAVIVQQGAVRPSSFMALSCVVYWCCNWLFGGIAFALSLASSRAADENDMEKARSLGKASLWVNVSCIIVTVLAIIIGGVVVYFVVFAIKEITDSDSYNPYDPYNVNPYWD